MMPAVSAEFCLITHPTDMEIKCVNVLLFQTLYGEFKGPNARSRRLQEWGRIRERAIQLGLINDATSTQSMLQGVIKNTQDRTKKKFQQKNQSGAGAVVWTQLDDTVMDCVGRDNYLTSFKVPGGITWGQMMTNQQEAGPETALTTAGETSSAPSIYFTTEDGRLIGLGTPLAQSPATNATTITTTVLSTVPSTRAGSSNATTPSTGPPQESAMALSSGKASSADAAPSTVPSHSQGSATALSTGKASSADPALPTGASQESVTALSTGEASSADAALSTRASQESVTALSTGEASSADAALSIGASQESATALSTGEASSADVALSTRASQASERNRDEIEARLQLIRSTPLFRRTPEEVTLLRTYLSLQILEDMLQGGTPTPTLTYVL
ncbi:mucin-5B-like isoform X1 [Amphibalanus amphitrite]|uniref:mucin-5B-like isoform X1 n=2 Tax=Amphibalanus amphitrite TaxID=1232801 RepID=UPI001C911776|nr:mucin-5B-like isoform X1 [Amphibalanus amphitrite]